MPSVGIGVLSNVHARFRIVRLDADALAGRRLPDHGAKDRVFRGSPTAGGFFRRNYVLTTVTAPLGAPGRAANTFGTSATNSANVFRCGCMTITAKSYLDRFC
jgi:hypothetical protein